MVWVLVGVRGCVAVDMGHGLVTLLSLSVSIKDRSLYKTLGKSKTCCSLVVDLALFGPTVRVSFWWRGLGVLVLMGT